MRTNPLPKIDPIQSGVHTRVDYKWIALSVTTIGARLPAILRQAGMVTSFALSLAVAAGSLPRDVMLRLFVGTNVSLGSQVMQDFVVGMHSAFAVSIVLCLIAAGISLVRGREDRKAVPVPGSD